MKLIDRRFLNISLTVAGVADEPADNPATGIQYIVGENPSGDFASASPNQIARFDGSAWSFITPKAGELEVLNLDAGEILQFNGEEWVTAASLGGEAGTSIQAVDDIVYGYHDAYGGSTTLSPANLKALRGRPYFAVNDGHVILFTDNLLEEGSLGSQYFAYPEGITALAGFGDGKIHHFTYDRDGYVDDFSSNNLQNGEYIFNKADNTLYCYDANNHKFIKVGGKRHYVVDVIVSDISASYPVSNSLSYSIYYRGFALKLVASFDNNAFAMERDIGKGFCFANITSSLSDEPAIYSVLSEIDSDDKAMNVIHDLYDGDTIYNKADGFTYVLSVNGNSKSFVKVSTPVIDPVLDIVFIDYNEHDARFIGEKYVELDDDGNPCQLFTAVGVNDWGNGTSLLNGERYASLNNHRIYQFNSDKNVIISDIPVGVTFFNNADNSLYFYNGTDFVNLNASGGSAAGFYEPVAPVLDILNIGSNQPDYPSAAGDKFIFYDPDESQAYGELYNAPSSADWGNGTNISAGQRYASLNEHKIYVFQGDGNEAIISDIPVGATFLNKNDNCLYTYDGSSFVKSASYEPVAPVLAIVPSGSALPANAATGDAFLNTSNAKFYTATAANTWDSGTLTANGSRYASSSDHKIYVSNGTALTATNILNGDLFLNKEENIVYAYDASVPAFVKVGTSSLNITTENHSLTAADVNAKGFSLSFNIAAGQESNTLLFVSGIAQTVGVDFSASGNSISWNNKALDDIALTAGDSFLVQYIRG